MRITYSTATVLCALARGHGYGFEILDVTGLPAGTVYPILRRLDDGGLVRSSWEAARIAHAEGRPPRRNYRITGEGQRLAAEAIARYPALASLFGETSGGQPEPA